MFLYFKFNKINRINFFLYYCVVKLIKKLTIKIIINLEKHVKLNLEKLVNINLNVLLNILLNILKINSAINMKNLFMYYCLHETRPKEFTRSSSVQNKNCDQNKVEQ